MGRGRQKAKHTKIARELKSYSPSVNYAALEKELGHPDDAVRRQVGGSVRRRTTRTSAPDATRSLDRTCADPMARTLLTHALRA